MPLRNLIIVAIAVLVSLACYSVAANGNEGGAVRVHDHLLRSLAHANDALNC